MRLLARLATAARTDSSLASQSGRIWSLKESWFYRIHFSPTDIIPVVVTSGLSAPKLFCRRL